MGPRAAAFVTAGTPRPGGAPVRRAVWLPLAVALAAPLGGTGCYAGARATRDVNISWQGRSRTEIEGRWGRPAGVTRDGGDTLLHWSHSRLQFTLPSGAAEVSVGPGHAEAVGVFRPGEIWHSTTTVTARVNPAGVVTRVGGPSLRWGPPNDVNLHWGLVMGLDAGMGRLDATSTPLPSGGLYIGGMLGPRLGLVGTFSLASGTGDKGGAMGFAGGMAVQWWPATRVWLRTGPVAVLAFDPGFSNPGFSPGLDSGASLAVVKVGRFVLDLRADLVTSTSVVFGWGGVGVNVN